MSRRREMVQLTRAVQVECVPDGTPLELQAGRRAEVTQALGSNFTLIVDGQLVRLKGSDADAIGRKPAAAAPQRTNVAMADVQGLVWKALKTCYDPEIPVDVVELGLIYDCELTPFDDEQVVVTVQMTLTAPGCGMGQVLGEEVAEAVLAVPRVAEVNVHFVFDPPWDRSRMSDAALLTLGL